MLATTLVQVYYLSGATLAVLGVLTLVWKAVSAFEHTKRSVETIEAEMRPNGGSSLADKVNAISTEQKAVGLALVVADGKTKLSDQIVTSHIEADRVAFAVTAQASQRIEATLVRIEDKLMKGTP